MVAEQWCRRRSGGDRETARETETEREREREEAREWREVAAPSRLPVSKKPSWGRLALARRWWRRGVGRKEGREGESTRQGRSKDRPQAHCVLSCRGGDGRAEVMLSCGCSPQH